MSSSSSSSSSRRKHRRTRSSSSSTKLLKSPSYSKSLPSASAANTNANGTSSATTSSSSTSNSSNNTTSGTSSTNSSSHSNSSNKSTHSHSRRERSLSPSFGSSSSSSSSSKRKHRSRRGSRTSSSSSSQASQKQRSRRNSRHSSNNASRLNNAHNTNSIEKSPLQQAIAASASSSSSSALRYRRGHHLRSRSSHQFNVRTPSQRRQHANSHSFASPPPSLQIRQLSSRDMIDAGIELSDRGVVHRSVKEKMRRRSSTALRTFCVNGIWCLYMSLLDFFFNVAALTTEASAMAECDDGIDWMDRTIIFVNHSVEEICGRLVCCCMCSSAVRRLFVPIEFAMFHHLPCRTNYDVVLSCCMYEAHTGS